MMRRTSALNSQPSIVLHIDELVLHGLPLTRGQGFDVQAAIETELARLLTEQGLSCSSAGANSNVSAGTIQITENNRPSQLGHQIAQAIYGSLAPTASSPLQNRSIEGACR